MADRAVAETEAVEAIEIDAERALRGLVGAAVGIELGLVVVDFLFAYLDLVDAKVVQHLANLAREDGIGTWFSSTQAVGVGLAAWAVGWAEGTAGRRSGGWALLGALFTYIGMDDALGVHERVGSAVRDLSGSALFSIFPTYSWQLVFGPIFGGAGLFMLAFLWRRLAEPRLRVALGLALACFVLAVGMDFVEGLDGVFDAVADAMGLEHYTISHASKVTEEVLEMFGTTTFLAMFAGQLAHSIGARRIEVRIGPPR